MESIRGFGDDTAADYQLCHFAPIVAIDRSADGQSVYEFDKEFLVGIIGYPDIVSVGNTSIVIMGQALEAIVIIMMVYLLLNLIIALIMNRVNTKVVSAPR